MKQLFVMQSAAARLQVEIDRAESLVAALEELELGGSDLAADFRADAQKARGKKVKLDAAIATARSRLTQPDRGPDLEHLDAPKKAKK